MQPVITDKWRTPRPRRLLLNFADKWNKSCAILLRESGCIKTCQYWWVCLINVIITFSMIFDPIYARHFLYSSDLTCLHSVIIYVVVFVGGGCSWIQLHYLNTSDQWKKQCINITQPKYLSYCVLSTKTRSCIELLLLQHKHPSAAASHNKYSSEVTRRGSYCETATGNTSVSTNCDYSSNVCKMKKKEEFPAFSVISP